jgi:hypothetical protein
MPGLGRNAPPLLRQVRNQPHAKPDDIEDDPSEDVEGSSVSSIGKDDEDSPTVSETMSKSRPLKRKRPSDIGKTKSFAPAVTTKESASSEPSWIRQSTTAKTVPRSVVTYGSQATAMKSKPAAKKKFVVPKTKKAMAEIAAEGMNFGRLGIIALAALC